MKIKYRSIEEIEETAANLLAKLGTKTLPVDLNRIASGLGLQVEYATLGDEVSGVLIASEKSGTIGINLDHPPTRQRFTLAHEIGHYLLHATNEDVFIDKKYTAIFRDKKSTHGKDRIEIQANQFAAALLMPEEQVREAANEMQLDLGDEDALQQLARQFEVSVQAITYRLVNMDVFESKRT